jgi:hypothetical protein
VSVAVSVAASVAVVALPAGWRVCACVRALHSLARHEKVLHTLVAD